MRLLNSKWTTQMSFVALSAILLAGCPKKQPPPEQPTEQKTMSIGVVMPLTGDLATYGQNAKNGIEMAAQEINHKGDIKVELFTEDSKGQPQTAVSAMQKLISANKVSAIVGEMGSSAFLAMAPIANRQKVVIVSPAASSPAITNAGEYVFRIWPSDDFEASVIADYTRRKGYKKVAIVFVNNDYGRAMRETFGRKIKGFGASIVASELFQQNSTDMRAQLTKVKAAQADVIFLISYPKDTVIFLSQSQQLGMNLPILSTSTFEDPKILQAQKVAAEGVVFSSPVPPDPKDDVVANFKSAYQKKFGKEPGLVADYGYDCLKILVEGAQRGGGTDGPSIQQGLQKIKNFKGASGLINFDPNGDVVKPAGLKTVKNGKFVWQEKQNMSGKQQ